ncbi:MAG: ATP-dependent Clp protease proteolytic subunit [Planctomycetota bacterium]
MQLKLNLLAGLLAMSLGGTPAMAQDGSAEAETVEEAKSELELMREELEQLKVEYQLLQQRQRNELIQRELERAELESQASLEKARQERALADLRQSVAQMEAEAKLRKTKRDREVEQIKAEASMITAENSLRAAEVKRQKTETDYASQQYQAKLAELKGQLSVLETKNEVNDKVTADIEYLRDPLVDGTLYVSDRRISLNGAIVTGTADYVTERIHFFNNQSKEMPIFIVIDRCPGGSVMEGYRIVKAMESSPAPVHVVVKSYAASMAAVITTLADHSYAYPNAIILHHQMSSGMFGNLTQQQEQLDNGNEWARRLAVPVADRMGVSYERFVELMYENNSDGDWEEFADEAVKINWVNTTVDEIRETGIRERPTSGRWSMPFFFQNIEEDADGRPFIKLPPLEPFDHYFIHDPYNFYR